MQIKSQISNLKSQTNWLIFVILVVASILRLWNLGGNPPGLTPDEAALGYNAYSILHTGKDEFGKTLPIIFKSFGDFKPGLYVYLTIPSVAILGLNEFSTRLPSALAGVLSVYLIYLIVRKLFTDHQSLPTMAALVAAVNPYLIYFSRGAWEANFSLTLTLAGIYFFLKARENSKFIIHSSVLFALTLLAYQGAKLSTSIVLIFLIAIYWKDFWKIKLSYLITSVIVGALLTIPIVMTFFNGETQRLTIFSIFSYPRNQSEIQIYKDGYFGLFHSDQLNYFRMILSRWFNFYSGQFLMFEGDLANPIHTAPYQGILLLADLIALPIGLFSLFKNKQSKGSLFIILWLILAPFSSAISRDQTNAVRSLNTAVPIVAVISFGLLSILSWIDSRKFRLAYYIPVFALYGFSLVYFVDALFVHLPVHNSSYWRYGFREAVSYVTPLESKYKYIAFEQSFNQPYIYFLFYQKYDPAKWQKQSKLVSSQYSGDVGFETSLDKITFGVDWSVLRHMHSVLVAVSPWDIPPEIKSNPTDFPIIHEIKYLNGRDIAFDFIAIK